MKDGLGVIIYYGILYYLILYYIMLSYLILYYTISYYIISCHIILYDRGAVVEALRLRLRNVANIVVECNLCFYSVQRGPSGA